MDTITLAGPLEAKLEAMRDAGFGQVMLSARDLVGHPGGRRRRGARRCAPAACASPASRCCATSRACRATCTTTRSTSPSRCSRCARRSAAACCWPARRHRTHASDDLDAHRARPAQARDAGGAAAASRSPTRACRGAARSTSSPPPGTSCAAPTARTSASASTRTTSSRRRRRSMRWTTIDPAKIFLVQLSDFMWHEVRTPEERIDTARHFRVFPGEGVHSDAARRPGAQARPRSAIAATTASRSSTTTTSRCRWPPWRRARRRSALWLAEDILRRSVPLPGAHATARRAPA